MNVNNNSREEDESDEDTSDEGKSYENKTVEEFDAILKDIKNDIRTTKPVSVKARGSNVNLPTLIIKLINKCRKKDYGFDKVLNIFDEILSNSKY